MSTPLTDWPRYRPVEATPEQEADMASSLKRLAAPSDDPSEPPVPAEPSEPTVP